MRPMPFVAVQPGGEGARALGEVTIQLGVGPFAERGLDEAFDLAVGARGVGPREQVADAEVPTRRGKPPAAVARAVIGHHRGDANTEAAQAADGALEKARRGATTLVGQHLAMLDARIIVDRHVDELPAGAPYGVATIATDPMPRADNARQFLNVQVHELARACAFVMA
jgi:hypothetical protein